MRLTESSIRRIINQEAKRVLRESDERHSDSETMNHHDPVGFLERHMTLIEDLFQGGYDHDRAMDEAEGIIEDLCFDLNNVMHDWLMDHLRGDEMDHDEPDADDMEDSEEDF
jgi:hypothetical protein